MKVPPLVVRFLAFVEGGFPVKSVTVSRFFTFSRGSEDSPGKCA